MIIKLKPGTIKRLNNYNTEIAQLEAPLSMLKAAMSNIINTILEENGVVDSSCHYDPKAGTLDCKKVIPVKKKAIPKKAKVVKNVKKK